MINLNKLMVIYLFSGLFFVGNVFSQSSSIDISELIALMGNEDAAVLKDKYVALSKQANLSYVEQARLAAMALGVAQQELDNLDKAEHAFSLLSEVIKRDDSPVLLAMLGTAESLIGRDAPNVIKKTRSVRKSVKKLNEAAEKASTALERTYIHFLRAQVFTRIPSFFKASKDAAPALQESIDAFRELDQDMQQSLVEFLGAIYELSATREEATGNIQAATRYREKIIEIAPGTYIAKKAAEKLNN